MDHEPFILSLYSFFHYSSPDLHRLFRCLLEKSNLAFLSLNLTRTLQRVRVNSLYLHYEDVSRWVPLTVIGNPPKKSVLWLGWIFSYRKEFYNHPLQLSCMSSRPFGVAEHGGMLLVFKNIPDLEQWVFEPSLSFCHLSDEAVLYCLSNNGLLHLNWYVLRQQIKSFHEQLLNANSTL